MDNDDINKSVRVTLDLPSEAVARLLQIAKAQHDLVAGLGISSLAVQGHAETIKFEAAAATKAPSASTASKSSSPLLVNLLKNETTPNETKFNARKFNNDENAEKSVRLKLKLPVEKQQQGDDQLAGEDSCADDSNSDTPDRKIPKLILSVKDRTIIKKPVPSTNAATTTNNPWPDKVAKSGSYPVSSTNCLT